MSEEDEWSVTTITHQFDSEEEQSRHKVSGSSRRQPRLQSGSGSPFCGHEEDSNPPGLGPGDTRGRTEVPDQSRGAWSVKRRAPAQAKCRLLTLRRFTLYA